MNRAIVLLLVSLVASGEALKCYQCNGCEEGQRGNPVNCDSTAGSCAKLILGSRIEKMCTPSATCKLADVEKGITNILSGFSSAISGDKSASSSEAKMVHCCDTDYCNSASTALPALALLVPLTLAALLR